MDKEGEETKKRKGELVQVTAEQECKIKDKGKTILLEETPRPIWSPQRRS